MILLIWRLPSRFCESASYGVAAFVADEHEGEEGTCNAVGDRDIGVVDQMMIERQEVEERVGGGRDKCPARIWGERAGAARLAGVQGC